MKPATLVACLTVMFFNTNSIAAPPECFSSSSDPDGDGWGWENNASCQITTNSQEFSVSRFTIPNRTWQPNIERLQWEYSDVAGNTVACSLYGWASTHFIPVISEPYNTIRFDFDKTFTSSNPDGSVTTGTWMLENGILKDTSIVGLTGRNGTNLRNIDKATDDHFGLFVWQSGGVDDWGTIYGETGSHFVDYWNAQGSEYYHCVGISPTGNSTTILQPSLCIDADGDGWGWDGSASCRVN